MADSNMTKKALASALKELMKTVPFSKISVGDICNMCEMNRKSFYYHFKDKYDLINWIYTSEFVVGDVYKRQVMSLSVTGQMVCSAIFDHYGFFGVKKIPFKKEQIPAYILVVIGIMLVING